MLVPPPTPVQISDLPSFFELYASKGPFGRATFYSLNPRQLLKWSGLDASRFSASHSNDNTSKKIKKTFKTKEIVKTKETVKTKPNTVKITTKETVKETVTVKKTTPAKSDRGFLWEGYPMANLHLLLLDTASSAAYAALREYYKTDAEIVNDVAIQVVMGGNLLIIGGH